MDFSGLKTNLEARGYTVSVFADRQEAAAYLDREIDHRTVGIGGSVTVEEMGLYPMLSSHNQVFWHWKDISGMPRDEIYQQAQTADVYLSSVNGIAETGEIIQIDGTCNRVSAMLYGHKKVYFIVGSNKIAPDYDSALFRARNTAAPRNAQRLNRNTPCAKEGNRCYDCNSPERICRALSVLWTKPGSMPFEVVLIDEPLGY